ncbi:MAG: hypothetical protein ABLT11_04755 [Candidatus Acidiferrum sp.]
MKAQRGLARTTRAVNITLAIGTEAVAALTMTITGIADAKDANVTMVAITTMAMTTTTTTTTTTTRILRRLRPVIFE